MYGKRDLVIHLLIYFPFAAAIILVVVMGIWFPEETGPPDRRPTSQVITQNASKELLLPVSIDGKMGYINGRGKIIIKPRFFYAGRFSEGLASVRSKFGTTYEVIDKTGMIVVPGTFQSEIVFKEGQAAFREGWKSGYVDKSGRVVVQPQFNDAEPFCEGRAVVRKGELAGAIDKTGNVVVPIAYEELDSFSEGLAAFVKDDKVGFLDKTGRVVIPATRFNLAHGFSEGLAFAECKLPRGGYLGGYIDKTGKYVIPPGYPVGGPFRDGLAAVEFPGYGYFIDRKGKAFIPGKFVVVGDFSEGLAAVKVGNKWGFIDRPGKMVIKPQYDDVKRFRDGLARVKVADGWGYIDRSGKWIWKPPPRR